jgi:ribonuclease G
MSKTLVINAVHNERRVALIEQGSLVELFIEHPGERGLVGGIYKGKVVRVLPGMDAAFVDLGLEKAGFLYVSDAAPPDIADPLELTEDNDGIDPEVEVATEAPVPSEAQWRITDLLHPGQELLVQIAKDPISTKGARLTTHITLPGRLLVFLPTVDNIGVSRRIADEVERNRLKEMVERLRPPGTGFIIRTAAEGIDEEALKADMDFLTRLWEDVQARAEHVSAPAQLYQDLDLIRRTTRDLFTAEVNRVLIDDAEEYRRLLEFVRTFMPALAPRVEYYAGSEPLFDFVGIELEIERTFGRKVWLKSGGYIVIDETEALTAIDVNTGKYVGKYNLEDTITKINIEAVKEIVCQLRLRDLGGIIIIDFIDMERPANREKVFNALQEALVHDRARTNILRISELGLVEMTRKRVRESLSQSMSQVCPACEGTGRVKSPAAVSYEIIRAIEREARGRTGNVVVMANPSVGKHLINEENEALESIEHRLGIQVRVDSRWDYHREQFEVRFGDSY